MTSSDYAAWYGAIVATGVAFWDVVKWAKSGPSITGEAKAGWQSIGVPETEGKTLSIATVTNRGDRPTTLTSWGMYWYPPGSSSETTAQRKAFIVHGGLGGHGKVPKRLESGDVWQGLVIETPEHEELFKTGRLYFVFKFSHSDKELLIELKKG